MKNYHFISLQLSKYSINEPSIDSSNNVIPINSNRNKAKLQGLIKKNTRLIKTVYALKQTPSLKIKNQISNYQDLENEIDSLLKYIIKLYLLLILNLVHSQ